MWEPQVSAFAEHFDVIRPDIRGFGKSELPPKRWSPVADLLRLVDELRLKPVHVIGCLMGASPAIDFAFEHAERISKQVLIGPEAGCTNFCENLPELSKHV